MGFAFGIAYLVDDAQNCGAYGLVRSGAPSLQWLFSLWPFWLHVPILPPTVAGHDELLELPQQLSISDSARIIAVQQVFSIDSPFAGTVIETDRPCPQLDCWHCRAEASASGLTSASCYHVKENILVVAIIEAVLKLRKVQREILFAHIVIGAENAALQERPKRFDAVGINLAAHEGRGRGLGS